MNPGQPHGFVLISNLSHFASQVFLPPIHLHRTNTAFTPCLQLVFLLHIARLFTLPIPFIHFPSSLWLTIESPRFLVNPSVRTVSSRLHLQLQHISTLIPFITFGTQRMFVYIGISCFASAHHRPLPQSIFSSNSSAFLQRGSSIKIQRDSPPHHKIQHSLRVKNCNFLASKSKRNPWGLRNSAFHRLV